MRWMRWMNAYTYMYYKIGTIICIIIIIITISIIFISIIAVAWAQKTPPNFPATAKSVAKPFQFGAENLGPILPGGGV